MFGVAPSATAAAVLASETGISADTIDKLLVEHRLDRPPDHRYDLPAGSTVIVDEAGMLPTGLLAELAALAQRRTWRIALVGDHRQFSSVGRGGMFGLLTDQFGAIELERVHRFEHDWERDASLQLRRGDVEVVGHYVEHDRLHGGGERSMGRASVDRWSEHRQSGRSVLLMAPTNEAVDRLNADCQRRRLDAGELDTTRQSVTTGQLHFFVGDEVATRRNERHLITDRGDIVRNRSVWTVTAAHRNGSLTVTGQRGSVVLPAAYVAAHLDLAYATTGMGAQGRTVLASVLFIDKPTDVRNLYVPMTRGTSINEAFIATPGEATAADVFLSCLTTDWIDVPATTRRAELRADVASEPTLLSGGELRQLLSRRFELDASLREAGRTVQGSTRSCRRFANSTTRPFRRCSVNVPSSTSRSTCFGAVTADSLVCVTPTRSAMRSASSVCLEAESPHRSPPSPATTSRRWPPGRRRRMPPGHWSENRSRSWNERPSSALSTAISRPPATRSSSGAQGSLVGARRTTDVPAGRTTVGRDGSASSPTPDGPRHHHRARQLSDLRIPKRLLHELARPEPRARLLQVSAAGGPDASGRGAADATPRPDAVSVAGGLKPVPATSYAAGGDPAARGGSVLDDAYLTAEARARVEIDRQLAASGWSVQDRTAMNLYAGQGIAVREFIMATGHGRADYLLFIDQRAVGAIEAKPSGTPLAGVEPQSAKYSTGLPRDLPTLASPLPFLYEATGDETMFTDGFDPDPRSRPVFTFHRPETLARWLRQWRDDADGGSFRARLGRLGAVSTDGLRRIQVRAVSKIEASMRANRPRALAQMATGSGKTFMAANLAYRLVQQSDAERVLFLVDRANLGRQTLREFQQFATPGDGRKFTDLYNVQWLTSNRIDPAARVVITTVQRLYSMLRGEEDLAPDVDELSGSEIEPDRPVEVVYNPSIPIETFDVVIVDECHRSIYGVWRQVIEYFDAFLVGLTATPAKQTFGFFNQNLVVEYGHAEAVADGVNVDFDVYRIRTKISERGSIVEAGLVTKFRDRETRKTRLEKLDEDVVYDARQLDRDVVAIDQIRTVIRTFRDNLYKPLDEGGIFPGRTEVPKTLIFAKHDSHADDIVRICREEFGRGNDFAVKITYRTTGVKPEDLLNQFRNSFNPRIAVTVDMIATGTDVRPLECVMFMRNVRSRNFFEQMKGRGVRTIDPNDLQAVSADATAKTHFVLVDAVGVTEAEFNDTQPLERRKTESLKKLLDQVAAGVRAADVVSSIAGRLARLDRVISSDDRTQLADAADGVDLADVVRMLTTAVDVDAAWERAAADNGGVDPTDEQVAEVRSELIEKASRVLAERPALRAKLIEVRRSYTQVLDETSKDETTEAGFSRDATDRARQTVESWRAFVAEHKDDIDALEILYSRPYGERLTLKAIKELAATIGRPPYNWTPARLWSAYETLDASRVKGSPGTVLTNLVSLVRQALEPDGELVAYPLTVDQRFRNWLAQQRQAGTEFTTDQQAWLTRIKDHLATSLSIAPDDFELEPFVSHGGYGRANTAFSGRLAPLLNELARELVA